MNEEEEQESKSARWRAYMSSDPASTLLEVQMNYGDVRVFIAIQDSDEGVADLMDLLKYVPKIVATSRGESAIRRQVRGLDEELSKLLEGDE